VKRIVWIGMAVSVMAVLLVSDVSARAIGWEEVFFNANQAYRQGRYQEAIDGYRRLIRSGHRSGHIYYNLGNAWFRMHRLGWAILNYERASILMPRDADLNFNLRYALNKTQDAIPEANSFISTTFFWLKSFGLSELFWGFTVVNLLFWGILLIRLFLKSEWTYYFSIAFLILWLVTGLSLGLKGYDMARDDRAVILSPEADILAGPDAGDTILFRLHEGAIVHYERSEDGWSLIHLSGKKRGWVKVGAVEPVIADVGLY